MGNKNDFQYGPLHGPAYPEKLKKNQRGEFVKVILYLAGAGALFATGSTTLGWIILAGAAVTFVFGWTYGQIENRGAQMLFLFLFLGVAAAAIFVVMGGVVGF